jgi:superfamily II DNA or RNA helicase
MQNTPIELVGNAEERLETFRSIKTYTDGRLWVLINREGHRVLPQIAKVKWDAVILDESHCIKNPKASITHFFCKNFRDVKHRFCLSGTPAPENDIEYFQQMKFLDRSVFGIENYWEFRNRFTKVINYKPFFTKEGRRFLVTRLSSHCFFLKRRDVGLQNKIVYEKRIVQLPKKIRKLYESIIATWSYTHGGFVNETIHAMTVYIWLRRLLGGFIEDDFVNPIKLDELKDILSGELAKDQVIIVAKYRQEVEKLARVFRKEATYIYGGMPLHVRSVNEKAFRSGRKRLIVIQPDAVKLGTNLSNCDTMIFYSTPEGYEARSQVEARQEDVDNLKVKLIIDLIVERTYDVDIYKSVRAKKSAQDIKHEIFARLQNARCDMV